MLSTLPQAHIYRCLFRGPYAELGHYLGDSDCRLMRQVSTLDISLEQLAILCAISIFSPDREGLSQRCKVEVEAIQEQLIPVS